MKRMFRIILIPETKGGFTVTVPSLPGCITQGEIIVEAKKMAFEAILIYLEDLIASGEEIPNDMNSLELSLIVA